MEFPSKLKYTKEHEWIRVENGNIAVIGITDFAQGELGDIVYVEVETVEETLEADAVFGVIEAVKTTSDLFMPVGGKVLSFNEALEESPDLINEAPYEKGWIIKVEMSDPAELDELMDAEAYQELVE